IHVDGIDLVIHADPPAEHKAYVHRSGRTARGGADGVVVTLQTRAQARDVTAMMRKAGITPHAAIAVNADSEVLAEIAGPPADRVQVSGKVAELVRAEDRLAKNDRPGVGKPWEGRPRRDRDRGRSRDRKPRDDRFRDRGPRDTGFRDNDRFDGAARPAADTSAAERPARPQRAERPARFDRDDRPARSERFQREESAPRFDRDDRPARDQRPYRADRFNPGNRNDRLGGHDRRSGNRSFGDRQDRRDNQGGNDWYPRANSRPGAQRPGSSWRPYGGGNQGDSGRGGRDGWNRDDRGR